AGRVDQEAAAAATDAGDHRPAGRPLPGPRLGRGDGQGLAAVDRGGSRLATRGPLPDDLRAHPRQRRRAGTDPPLPRRRASAGARPRPAARTGTDRTRNPVLSDARRGAGCSWLSRFRPAWSVCRVSGAWWVRATHRTT